jgi:hypothetical protein
MSRPIRSETYLQSALSRHLQADDPAADSGVAAVATGPLSRRYGDLDRSVGAKVSPI